MDPRLADAMSLLDEPDLERWRQLVNREPPEVIAVWATSDISEEYVFAGWELGCGEATRRAILAGEGRGMSSADVALLRTVLDRLDGRWPEWFEGSNGFVMLEAT